MVLVRNIKSFFLGADHILELARVNDSQEPNTILDISKLVFAGHWGSLPNEILTENCSIPVCKIPVRTCLPSCKPVIGRDQQRGAVGSRSP
ncbi:hypothetical protein TNCV_622831 [Trichonephila clavipes]|nr:hypothetical protein TNCV_622831 [Trichonephila clavipes]